MLNFNKLIKLFWRINRMSNKNLLIIVLVAVLLFAGWWFFLKADTPEEVVMPEFPCFEEEYFCVGFVTDVGEVDDKSFNQASWEAVQEFAAANDVFKFQYVETKDAKDYEANINLFVDDGYDIVVTSGFAIGDYTAAAAKANPGIYFIGVDQYQGFDIDNFTGVQFNEDFSGFLAGAVAAMLTETDIIAGVYGTNLVPPVQKFKQGYEAGAAYINPDITVISTYSPGGFETGFTDPEWGATTAAQAIDNGADFVFGAGGQTGNGAIIEAGTLGVYCIGVDVDQWLTLPEAHSCLVTSAMKLISPAVIEMLEAYLTDSTPAGNFFGGAGLAPYHDFESLITSDMQATLDQIVSDLESGAVMTGFVLEE
jgi:basic membrane protein A